MKNNLATVSVKTDAAMVGQDPRLLAVLAKANQVAATRVPVLITGETGTGKELLARFIHDRGRRPDGPYVVVNCGTLSRELADSSLFGHERGSFTGAAQRKTGWFEEAHGGTLVLDEIGELPLDVQAKLLRVLETGLLRRVGGAGEVAVEVRVVAVTWRDLRGEIREGRFRADLFHRLSGFELTLPPLRERRADIPLLVEEFARAIGNEVGPRTFNHAAVAKLMSYDWPGNVRELRNVVMRAAIEATTQGVGASVVDLPRWDESVKPPRLAVVPRSPTALPRLAEVSAETFPGLEDERQAGTHDGIAGISATHKQTSDTPNTSGEASDQLSLVGQTLADIEKAVLQWALNRNGGSRRQAARALSVPRSTFYDKAKRYGLA